MMLSSAAFLSKTLLDALWAGEALASCSFTGTRRPSVSVFSSIFSYGCSFGGTFFSLRYVCHHKYNLSDHDAVKCRLPLQNSSRRPLGRRSPRAWQFYGLLATFSVSFQYYIFRTGTAPLVMVLFVSDCPLMTPSRVGAAYRCRTCL